MNNAMLTQLLYCFCVLSALLLLGTLLRAVVPAFRKLFLPASVIGGFIGLLAGPIIWKTGGIPFPQAWITTWAALPGILIVPVVASTPLGMKFGSSGLSARKTSTNMVKTFAVLSVAGSVQILLGLCVREFFVHTMPDLDLYATFGYELTQGFSGGHGTAGVIGSYYKGLELPYWELAQGITTTTATFGLIGGMIIGIIAINVAARTGHTAILTKPAEIPPDMAKGIQWDPDQQKSMGKETTLNSSIESLTFHLAVILGGCGLAYIIMTLVKFYKVPVITQIPIWPYALVVMFGVNFLIQKLGLGNLIDGKTKSRIAGTCSDYAITAAIASMPVHAILPYIVPILVMVALG
jgi:ESS family glutamate:Na+ symporter